MKLRRKGARQPEQERIWLVRADSAISQVAR